MPSSKRADAVPVERLRLIVESYRRLTGKPLLDTSPLPCRERVGERVEAFDSPDATPILAFPLQGGRDDELRRALWEAPRAIVAHGTEADPVFFYGNRLALQLFEMDFGEFVRLLSRFSAEPLAREERARLLERVAQQGYVDGYSGMRIAKSGRRFMISDGTVWNLADEAGVLHGQAAVFSV
jgi:hypothetical protein